MITIQVEGNEQVQAFFAKAPEAIKRAATKATAEFAKRVKAEAQAFCPFRTGFLRGSIFYRTLSPMMYLVGAKAFYAGYVEWGTSRFVGRHYLSNAIINQSNFATNAYADEIEREIRLL